MAWARITEADLLTKISGDELESFRATALASGQVDPVEPSITIVTDLVRGHVRAYTVNTLGAEGTIPKELLGPALDLLVVEIQKRCAGVLLDLGETRKTALQTAMSILGRVANGTFAIEHPTTETTGITRPRPAITEKTASLSAAKQAGI
jgi:hypothetical protein